MFILPSRGTIEIKHEAGREGTWLSQDRFAIVPPNQAHETRAGIGAHSHVAIYATGSVLKRLERENGSLSEFRRRTSTTRLFRRSDRLRTLQALLVGNGRHAYGNAHVRHGLSSALLVQCIAEALTGDAVSSASHREHGMTLVAELRDYLTLHADRDVPLDALEERFGVSRRHITRLFRAGTGASIGEFQQRIRLDNANELLKATDLPIGEIALRVGFDSGAALAHAMRRADGQSPSEVRKRMARRERANWLESASHGHDVRRTAGSICQRLCGRPARRQSRTDRRRCCRHE
ncbi:helix-turn-helix domain-containing protein [Tardiphaga sp. P5_C10]